MLDAVAVGLVLPLLPFYVMQLGANALQLSLVVSANYVAQMLGCLVMGKVSDQYGRRLALLLCLGASALSFFSVASARTVSLVALARIISGSFGGLMPVMQSAVADSTDLANRPKYLGRVMAAFGVGFVAGPAICAVLPSTWDAADKIRLAAVFPLIGLLIAAVGAKETKSDVRRWMSVPKLGSKDVTKGPAKAIIPHPTAPLNREVTLLVLNGFLNMYAFGTETIYAVFIKDTFGFGEAMLSGLFAVNGLLTGVFQVFLIKPLISAIGMHATLALGNVLLALGMLGLAVVRNKPLHFLLFACHILGFSIADTALVSLISRYSASSSQGRDLSLNQAAQSAARVFSPLLAGLLYERSKHLARSNQSRLPLGALPFLVGGLCPLLAAVIPAVLHLRRRTPSSDVTPDEDGNGNAATSSAQ
jgi:DHA1 family tetracycline resistance protein-like MFS transporter